MSTTAHIGKNQAFGQIAPPNLPDIPEFGDGKDDGHNRLRRYRLGLALFLASLGMLFVGLGSAYVVRRGIPTYDAAIGAYSLSWEPLQLPIKLLLTNTLLLIGATFAAEFARKQARRPSHADATGKDLNRISGWISLSAALAVGFIAGQVLAWQRLHAGGHSLSFGARTAFFYVITGAHAFHGILGILLLAWVAFRAQCWSAVLRCIATDLAVWYLHSVAVLWICLFCFLVFA